MSHIVFIPGGGGGSGERGPEGPAGPKGEYNNRGEWGAGTEYAKGDAVQEGGSSYASLKGGNTGHKPSELGEWWGLIAKKGAEGAAGGQGPEGKEGKEGKEGTAGAAGAGFKLSAPTEVAKERASGAAFGPLSETKDAWVQCWALSTAAAETTFVIKEDELTIVEGGVKTAGAGGLAHGPGFFARAGHKYTITMTNGEKLKTTHWFVS